jgi:hypothetical protein
MRVKSYSHLLAFSRTCSEEGRLQKYFLVSQIVSHWLSQLAAEIWLTDSPEWVIAD